MAPVNIPVNNIGYTLVCLPPSDHSPTEKSDGR